MSEGSRAPRQRPRPRKIAAAMPTATTYAYSYGSLPTLRPCLPRKHSRQRKMPKTSKGMK
eukprot:scaffold262278_cov38-Prasinocladus_malaysianus.AAC.1